MFDSGSKQQFCKLIFNIKLRKKNKKKYHNIIEWFILTKKEQTEYIEIQKINKIFLKILWPERPEILIRLIEIIC